MLIDFWASGCAPAGSSPDHQLAEEYGEKIRVVKVDVDANPKTASQMQIRAMPTILMVKNGAVVGQLVGRQPKDKLKQLIAPSLI